MKIALGTGRCGTKTLAELFGMHHERKIEDFVTPWQLEHQHQYEAIPWPDKAGLLAARFAEIDVARYRESNNLYIHFVRELHAMDPDIRIVLLVRDLFDFIRSAYSRGWHTRGVFGHRPAPDDPAWGRWPFWSPVVQCAWIWQWRNTVALDALEDIPRDRWMLVNAHDIYARASDIAAFYGIAAKPDVVEESKAWNALSWPFQVGEPEAWPARERNEAMIVAQETIERLKVYGYRHRRGDGL